MILTYMIVTFKFRENAVIGWNHVLYFEKEG